MNYTLLYIYGGMIAVGAALIALTTLAGLRNLKTPKPTRWEREWNSIEEDLSK
jgi:hypothetical protein